MAMTQALDRVRRDGNTVLLSFSNGKDSIACWSVLQKAGFKVVPFYYQLPPGLEFVERSLRYYEDHFGEHIYRVTDPLLYRWIDEHKFQPPDRLPAIELLNLPDFGFPEIEAGVKHTVGLPSSAWTAIGSRWADSPMRRLSIPQIGYTESRRKFYPVADLNKEQLIKCLQRAKVKLPVDYEMFGRSFDGIDYQYIIEVKRRYPKDYAKLLEWFPLLEIEFFRAHIARKHGQDKFSAGPNYSQAAAARRASQKQAETDRVTLAGKVKGVVPPTR